jgi:hypothetical protein
MVMRAVRPVHRMPTGSGSQETSWELPWVERSRMAMPAASIADALWYRRRPSALREDTARIADRPWV